MIVRRPDVDEREVVSQGELDVTVGLVGDNWQARGSSLTPDGKANADAQITMMNSRALTLMAQSEERWQLAGDQLIIDIDMSIENLPPGSRLALGTAVIEITEKPHTGCAKFADRFGTDALQFVSTPSGRALRLRGVNTRVVRPGTIRVGDVATKLAG
jgi:MOSC domain-containing protein YiiM